MTANKKAMTDVISTESVRRGVICTNSWAGRAEKPCRIIGETPKRYRIEVDEKTWLPGAWLEPGQQRLVPKTAVLIIQTTLQPYI